MPKTVDRPRGTEPAELPLPPTESEVRHALDRVLTSPVFHGSKRCQKFLEYVCERTLAGEASALKERTVAVDVFGRSPLSHLSDDTIVRVGAREVRKRLAQYYVTEDGSASTVRIDLLPGSYAPEFRYARQTSEQGNAPVVPEVLPEPEIIPVRRKKRSSKWIWIAVGSVALVAALLSLSKLGTGDANTKLFNAFWRPVYSGSEPLLLAVGNPIVYHPSSRAVKLSEDRMPPQKVPLQRTLQVAPEEVNGSDMIPVLNQYVGFGDLVAAAEISSMLSKNDRGTRIRVSNNVSFADLRQSPTVLIGAFTNRWTMELGQNWKFQFGRTADNRSMIFDSAEPSRQWAISAQADGLASQDYILICRIRSSSTGGFLIVGAGLKQFGTEAAGRLLADPTRLGSILSKLPSGWESKNLQFVLLSRIIGGAPAQPEMVASRVW